MFKLLCEIEFKWLINCHMNNIFEKLISEFLFTFFFISALIKNFSYLLQTVLSVTTNVTQPVYKDVQVKREWKLVAKQIISGKHRRLIYAEVDINFSIIIPGMTKPARWNVIVFTLIVHKHIRMEHKLPFLSFSCSRWLSNTSYWKVSVSSRIEQARRKFEPWFYLLGWLFSPYLWWLILWFVMVSTDTH